MGSLLCRRYLGGLFMRNSVMGLVFLPLIACSQGEPDAGAQPTQTTELVELEHRGTAADGMPSEGQYRAISEETGSVLIENLRADGTYTFSAEDGTIVEEGEYDQQSPELICFMPNIEDAVTKCYSDAIGEDGIWRTTDPDTGEVFTLERIGIEAE